MRSSTDRPWTMTEIARLKKLFPHNSNAEIAELMGRTPNAICGQAYKLKLKKTIEHKKAVGYIKIMKTRDIQATHEETVRLLTKCEKTFDLVSKLIAGLRVGVVSYNQEQLIEILNVIDVDKTLDYARVEIQDHIALLTKNKNGSTEN